MTEGFRFLCNFSFLPLLMKTVTMDKIYLRMLKFLKKGLLTKRLDCNEW